MAILKGSLGFKGETGDSAYQLAVKNGYEGTEAEWIAHFGLDLSGYVQTSDVEDNLTSTYATRPLSAKQGKVLNDSKQDKLTSGTTIKTINSNSLLGSGNISLPTTTEVGDVANLTTTATTVVGAINELDAKEGSLVDLTTTDDSSLVNAINELYDEIFFKPNETFETVATVFCTGQITGGTKSLNLTIPLPKRMDHINTITFNNFPLIGRGISGYLNGSGTYMDILDDAYTITYRIEKNLLTILIDSTTAFTNVNNNTPICFGVGGGFSITFSVTNPE